MSDEQVDYDEAMVADPAPAANDSPAVLSAASQRAAMDGMTGTLPDRGEEIEDLGTNDYEFRKMFHETLPPCQEFF